MTIKEYREKLIRQGRLGDLPLMENTKEIWSYDACFGYCIDAAERIGLSENTIKKLVRALDASFDNEKIEDAEEIFRCRNKYDK